MIRFVLLFCCAIPLAEASAAPSCPAGTTKLTPGQSIQAAADLAGPGGRLCITPGTYRLQSVTPQQGQHFYGLPGAILNGSRILTGFTSTGDQWVAEAEDPIGTDHGSCAAGHEACARPAGLFFDGQPLGRAATLSALAPGLFFFEPAHHRVHLADNPSGHLVEWATTRHAFAGPAEDITIEGLTIEKYANPAQEGAIWPGGKRWRLARIEARLNNGVGLVGGAQGTIRDCDVHHNGQLGIGAGSADGLLLERNQVWANNTNGFDDTWEAGGIKVAESRYVVFRGNHVHDNAGPGLWCDENCRDILIEGNTVEANGSAGIFYEISSGAVVRGNVLRENGTTGPPWFWGAEIQVAASRGVVITGNTITVRPGGKAVMLIDQNRWKAGGGYYTTSDDHVEDNQVTFLGNGLTGGVSTAGPDAANYQIIQTGGNRFDHNAYFVRAGAALQFTWGNGLIDLPAFRAAGQETLGTLTLNEP